MVKNIIFLMAVGLTIGTALYFVPEGNASEDFNITGTVENTCVETLLTRHHISAGEATGLHATGRWQGYGYTIRIDRNTTFDDSEMAKQRIENLRRRADEMEKEMKGK